MAKQLPCSGFSGPVPFQRRAGGRGKGKFRLFLNGGRCLIEEQPKLPFPPPSVAYLTSVLGPQSSRFLTQTITQGPEALSKPTMILPACPSDRGVCIHVHVRGGTQAQCRAIPPVDSAPRAWQGGSLALTAVLGGLNLPGRHLPLRTDGHHDDGRKRHLGHQIPRARVHLCLWTHLKPLRVAGIPFLSFARVRRRRRDHHATSTPRTAIHKTLHALETPAALAQPPRLPSHPLPSHVANHVLTLVIMVTRPHTIVLPRCITIPKINGG